MLRWSAPRVAGSRSSSHRRSRSRTVRAASRLTQVLKCTKQIPGGADVYGCSGPSTRRLTSSTSSCSLRAPGKSPCVRKVSARLFIEVSVSGCSGPSTRRLDRRASLPAACAPQPNRPAPASVTARLFIEVSVSGCSGPSTRRRMSSVSSWSLRAPAKSPCALQRLRQVVHRGERIRVLGPQHPARMASVSSCSLRAPAKSPCADNVPARLFIERERIRVLRPQHPAAGRRAPLPAACALPPSRPARQASTLGCSSR